jgi:cell division protein FtsN
MTAHGSPAPRKPASGAKRTARKPVARTGAGPRTGAGGTLLGIFIGLALGLALAAGVAWTLMGARQDAAVAQRDAKPSKSDTPEKPRFDFYKILPGGEEPKIAAEKKAPERPDRAVADKASAKAAEVPKAAERPSERIAAAEPSAAKGAKPGDRFWLQAGSFTQEADAENLKARLALAGWEAQVQSGTLPDKGVRYRVRLGPYDNADELNRIKAQLAQRGFDAAVIKY